MHLTPLHPSSSSILSSLQSDFVSKCKLIRERLESRESETHGKWCTEDQLKKSGNHSPAAIKSIIAYCRKFPESLVRLGFVDRLYIF